MSSENQVKRVAAWRNSLTEHGGSFQTPESIAKIKEARARQDESFRKQRQKEYERFHPERRLRAAATHRGKKHKPSVFTPEGKLRQDEGRHKRWHLVRGIINPACRLCVSFVG